MARRKRRGGGTSPLLLVLAALVLAVGAWYWLKQRPVVAPQGAQTAQPSTAVSAERVDARNEGRAITLVGTVRVVHPARDAEIGVAADAVVLVREVRMLQWQEHCAGTNCSYALEWSARPVDAHAFRDPKGHANATPFPFSSQRFAAGELRLGAFVVDAELAAAGAAMQPHAVAVASLAPNLAATFRDCEGALCTGDPAHPASGDLRVDYRVAAAGPRTLNGIQRGNRLAAH